jgi:hypothetical protein
VPHELPKTPAAQLKGLLDALEQELMRARRGLKDEPSS